MIDPQYLKSLPAWAARLAVKYATHTVSQFILHGNVRDLAPLRAGGRCEFHNLKTFLNKSLFAGRDRVLHFNRADGLTFADNETARDFAAFVKAYQTVQGAEQAATLSKSPAHVFPVIDRYLRARVAERKSLALIIEFAELIVPDGEGAHLAEGDRAALIYLRQWAEDPVFLQSDITFCLITEHLSKLHQDLVRNPYSAPVEIGLPDLEERREFIACQTQGHVWEELSALALPAVAELTGGLSRVHLRQVLAEAIRNRRKLELDALMARKKELIEAECLGLLEFIQPRFKLDMVAGADAAVRELRFAAELLRRGRLDVLPMGYLVCGPVGTGKTFMVTCFTGELGVPCVKLLNIRSQWQGVTEANLQKLLAIFRAMGPLGVVIDEADTWIGDRDASGDSGTSSRIFGAIASFMSDTSLRGRVLWFLITARPDLLPVDIKRQGRAEEHIPLFHPTTAADRQALFQVFVRKNRIETQLKSVEKAYQAAGAPRLSGADLEAVCIRAMRLSVARRGKAVTAADFAKAFAQFIPPVYAEQIEFQTLVAAMECTNRDLLPDEYREMPRERMARRLRELESVIE